MTPRALAAIAAALSAGASYLLLRDQTTDNDDTGEDVAGQVPVQPGGTLGARAVAVLNRYVGEKGQGPKGTPWYHRSPFIDRVNLGVHGDGKKLLGAPWCARAVRFAYEVAAQDLGRSPPFASLKSDLASVSKWKKYIGPHKIKSPKVGAVLLLGDKHATLIAKVLDERTGTVITVEGNHGDKVSNVKRTIDPSKDTILDVEAFVRSAAPDLVGFDLLWAEGC